MQASALPESLKQFASGAEREWLGEFLVNLERQLNKEQLTSILVRSQVHSTIKHFSPFTFPQQQEEETTVLAPLQEQVVVVTQQQQQQKILVQPHETVTATEKQPQPNQWNVGQRGGNQRHPQDRRLLLRGHTGDSARS